MGKKLYLCIHKNQPFHRLATTLDYDTSIYGTDYTK